jgi:hypothetical protein
MVGSSALAAVDAAVFSNKGRDKRAQRVIRVAPPRVSDALPDGTCERCGIEGAHRDAAACIGALRDRLADAEMAKDPHRISDPEPPAPAAHDFIRSLERGARRRR